jgi:hypothetical protein
LQLDWSCHSVQNTDKNNIKNRDSSSTENNLKLEKLTRRVKQKRLKQEKSEKKARKK